MDEPRKNNHKIRVLLVSNHNSVLEFDRLGRFPNLGLSSIAANVDREICDVKIADLIVAGRNPGKYYKKLLSDYDPHIVGLSCMVFQYHEALELARITKTYNSKILVIMGGYGPTVICDEIAESDDMQFIDYIIAGEGEKAFREFVNAIYHKNDFKNVPNLVYRDKGSVIKNPRANLIDLDTLKIPDRDARILQKGFHAIGYRADVIETSRGCVLDCNFCTIREMYGKKFRKYKIDRVIEDIRDARKHKAEAIFIVDDNITLDGKRYIEICDAITDAGLNKIQYGVQASVKGLKQTPSLIKKMAESGTRVAFLGIENVSDEALQFFQKSGEFKKSDTHEVVKELWERGITIIGGIISGYPDDTEESMWANFEFCKQIGLHDPIWYLLTPFPKTKIRDELLQMGLITNFNDYSRYNGFEANVKTKTMSSERLKELREELGFKYFTQAGTIWHMFKEEPGFAVRLILNQLLTQPGQFINYTKEVFRISNYLKK